MAEVVIKKMTEFPNDITVNKPVPGKTGFDYRVFFKKTDAEYDGGDGNKLTYNQIQHIREKG
jgi:hypothetical protein